MTDTNTPKARATVAKGARISGPRTAFDFALKAESQAIAGDNFKDSYEANKLVTPLYSLQALAQLMELSTWHNRAVKTIARDTVGLGWSIEPNNPEKPFDDKKAERAREFFRNPHPRMTLDEILYRTVVDFGSTGNGYTEIIREDDGVTPAGLNHIPAQTVRVHRSRDKVQQRRGSSKVWFKYAGVEEDFDAANGQELTGDSKAANEILHYAEYTARSDYYGLPDVLPAIGSILLDRKRQEYILDYFDNFAIPAWAVTVTGADVGPEFESTIRDYFQQEVREHRHATLVLSVAGDGVPTKDGKPGVEINFEKLSDETKEASFRLLGHDCRDEILSAHAVPPYRAGIAKEGALGGNIATEATEIYKSSVIEPRQRMIETRLTRYILRDGFELENAIFRFEDIDTRDATAEVERAVKMRREKAISKNELREAGGYDRSEEDGMDAISETPEPLMIDSSEPEEDDSEAVKALKRLRGDLTRIVAKRSAA